MDTSLHLADKYQAGPAAMAVKMGKPWVVGTLALHWWRCQLVNIPGTGLSADSNQELPG
jgi:hypothetical protein